jgi:hypothetical protein
LIFYGLFSAIVGGQVTLKMTQKSLVLLSEFSSNKSMIDYIDSEAHRKCKQLENLVAFSQWEFLVVLQIHLGSPKI